MMHFLLNQKTNESTDINNDDICKENFWWHFDLFKARSEPR